MNELANIPGNIVVVLTQQGIWNARTSEGDHSCAKQNIALLNIAALRMIYSWPFGQHSLVSKYTRICDKLKKTARSHFASTYFLLQGEVLVHSLMVVEIHLGYQRS